jgi:hypothetical protein
MGYRVSVSQGADNSSENLELITRKAEHAAAGLARKEWKQLQDENAALREQLVAAQAECARLSSLIDTSDSESRVAA